MKPLGMLYDDEREGDDVHIIVVHGLRDDWLKDDKSMWLLQDLDFDTTPYRSPPERGRPYVQVTYHRYDATSIFTGSWDNFNNVVDDLLALIREDESNKPLIFIGHGLGGLVVEAVCFSTSCTCCR